MSGPQFADDPGIEQYGPVQSLIAEAIQEERERIARFLLDKLIDRPRSVSIAEMARRVRDGDYPR